MAASRIHGIFGVLLLMMGPPGAVPADDGVGESASSAQLLADAQQTFQPLPKDSGTDEFPVTTNRVNLGRILFFDPRISDDGTVSCSRCHLPALYASDSLPKSRGAHDHRLPRNAPTILNVGLNVAQHWDGVFRTPEEQAEKALLGPAFANPDFATAMARIKGIPGYADLFRKTFPDDLDPITEANWAKAIGAYERTLMTPSRFDEYLRGERTALSPTEQHGLRLFLDLGCADCHNGPGVGGGSFEKFGVKEDYWKATGSQETDTGRFNVTKDDDDRFVFKAAGLRNVAMTAPYFHDGSVTTLPHAVKIMSRVQLGKLLSDDDTQAVVAFLASLTGRLPKEFAESPVLPPASFTGTP